LATRAKQGGFSNRTWPTTKPTSPSPGTLPPSLNKIKL
jgi:hypothetical protein